MNVEVVEDHIAEKKVEYHLNIHSLMGDTADFAVDVARSRARMHSGELRDSINAWPEGELGFAVRADAEHAIYNEYGTGIYATGPGGSRAKEIPWVYYNEATGQFYTTYGLRPQPFMQPAYDEAVAWLRANAPRYFR